MRQARESAMQLGKGQMPLRLHSPVKEVDELHQTHYEAGKVLQEANEARARHFAEMQQAQSVAQAQNKAKDEFLAMLGHELRNPLAALTSGITLLKLDNVPEASKQRAQDIIERQAKRLDLAHAVQECLDAYETQGKTKDYIVKLSVASAFIDADVTRLSQMIGNLLDNAFKYTPIGGKVEISVFAEGGQAILKVADSGIGISAALLPNIFDVFVQGPVANRAKGGLGIGLAVVQALVQQHGGSIKAESRGIKEGAVFLLTFPLSSEVSQPASSTKTLNFLRPLNILVIEDNHDARDVLCELLSSHSHTVTPAKNGLEGIEKALQSPPDVALVDIDLPDILGFEVAKRLRNDRRSEKIKLIAVTGYGQEADRQRALESGFDHHMSKPLNINELFTELSSYFSHSHQLD
jgi:signal transduction histidine kinase/ActR/RegA family two-component response regulator